MPSFPAKIGRGRRDFIDRQGLWWKIGTERGWGEGGMKGGGGMKGVEGC